MKSNFISSLYKPARDSHKGQNGKLLIIGGSAAYSGSPIFSILAARRFVDLIYFYPAEGDPFLVQAVKNIPEAIVVYDLEKVRDADCVLFGGGMGGAGFEFHSIDGAKKIVVDAEGFNYLSHTLVDERFILTPHMQEFKRYFDAEASEKNAKAKAAEHKCTMLLKGPIDIITDGKRVHKNDVHNAGMTKGGTGDVLAGLVAALACKNQNFEAACAAAYINGVAGNMLFKKYGYNFCASDLANELAEAYFRELGKKAF